MLLEELQQLKATFFESNAALVRAVEQTSNENCNSIENKLLLATSRLKAVDSYHKLLNYILKYPKSRTDSLIEATTSNAWVSK